MKLSVEIKGTSPLKRCFLHEKVWLFPTGEKCMEDFVLNLIDSLIDSFNGVGVFILLLLWGVLCCVWGWVGGWIGVREREGETDSQCSTILFLYFAS